MNTTRIEAEAQMLAASRKPEDDRLTAFPVARPEIYALWEKAISVHWVPKQINFNDDAVHFVGLPADRQQLVKSVLAFFASLDTLVNVNILERFAREFKIPEVDWFFAQQAHIESVHSVTYSLLINVYITSTVERQALFDAVVNNPAVERVAAFVRRCISSDESVGCRLFRMACVEGVLFARAFAIIYFITDGGKLPGLRESNALIAKDENFHMLGGAVIHNTVLPEELRVTGEEAAEVCAEVMSIADDLGRDALPAPVFGMKADQLREYTENQANIVLEYFGLPHIYASVNPFEFMEKLNLETRSNFFEVQETNYSAGHDNTTISADSAGGQSFVYTEDF
jgi:ribonucleotide reductase beta subunit family protein with ferritin-like domain